MNNSWYQALIKPRFTPPAKVFPIAWGILYFLIFCSIMLYIAATPKDDKKWGYIFFTVQLILNFLWSPVFFYYQNIKLSLVIACLMWGFVLLTIIFFYKTTKLGAILLVPYFLWVSFAIYLNYGILKLN